MSRRQPAEDVVEVTIRRKLSERSLSEQKMAITVHLPSSLVARLDRARAKVVEIEGQPVPRSGFMGAILADYLGKHGY